MTYVDRYLSVQGVEVYPVCRSIALEPWYKYGKEGTGRPDARYGRGLLP